MIQPPLAESEVIRLEFECFLRIAQDRRMRDDVSRNLERILMLGIPVAIVLPRIYFEVRQSDGEILEMWDLQMHDHAARRLLTFLRRFTPEQARLMHEMMLA
jgi:hypothetical protein